MLCGGGAISNPVELLDLRQFGLYMIIYPTLPYSDKGNREMWRSPNVFDAKISVTVIVYKCEDTMYSIDIACNININHVHMSL